MHPKARLALAGLSFAGVGTLLAVVGLSLAMGAAPRAAHQPQAPSTKADHAPERAKPAADLRRWGSPEPVARRPGTVRLATYNVENLFDAHDDPNLSGEHDDAGETKPEAHRRAVAEAIRRIDADIVALQEVESLQALLEFRDQFLTGLGYDHVASIDAGNDRGIEQSILSRFPVTNPRNWPDEPLGEGWIDETGQPMTFRRSPLVAEVTVPAGVADDATDPYLLTLVVVHHKSGREEGHWREGEADAVSNKIEAMLATNPEANIVVLGDFNCLLGDLPFEYYTEVGMTDIFADRDKADPAFVTHESGRIIDHILVSPAMQGEWLPDSRFILGTQALPKGSDWRTAPKPDGYASDHYPVVVDLIPRDL